MRQQLQQSRTDGSPIWGLGVQPAKVESRWLFRLVGAMEEAARPELRDQPCDKSVLAEFGAQLAQPASLGSRRR
jgi:hypothetical protein